MNPLLTQFIQEARDFLQSIGERLMALEDMPDDRDLMNELFRAVHTLKGNSGLFEFPEMTRVLHASEDLMDAVRSARVTYSRGLADRLLDAMDFVSMLIDEVEVAQAISAQHAAPAAELASALRAMIPAPEVDDDAATEVAATPGIDAGVFARLLQDAPESERVAAWHAMGEGDSAFLILYRPEADCFFKGEDPFFQARNLPGLRWGRAQARADWGPAATFDCYQCASDFVMLAVCDHAEVAEYFRYTPEQVAIRALSRLDLVIPVGHPNGGPVYGDFVDEAIGLLDRGDRDGLAMAARTMLELSAPNLWLSSALRWLLLIIDELPEQTELQRRLVLSLNTLTPPALGDLVMTQDAAGSDDVGDDTETSVEQVSEADGGNEESPDAPPPSVGPVGVEHLSDEERRLLIEILRAQAEVLELSADPVPEGVLSGVDSTLRVCLACVGGSASISELIDKARQGRTSPLFEWLEVLIEDLENQFSDPSDDSAPVAPVARPVAVPAKKTEPTVTAAELVAAESDLPAAPPAAPAGDVKFGRRAEDAQASKILKVDQLKIDRLMNLIGEMVVAKNALPYLANRAETRFGTRELSREIKAQYSVINRIAEEMQDAIMQVRMMPVSFIFQRFPRLVRDISRKLGKEINLVIEGDQTEADKNIVESLADPMIHIVRNSLDHGFEPPEEREAAGKPRAGRLVIRARQEADRAVIEVSDDGRGIDPQRIKRKAYEKGLIDEIQLERLSDQEAVNLVFAAGFSTAESISDLSGRGVGMDVVRTAIEKAGGAVALESVLGKGTTLQLSLPLSMAVSNVMIVESDAQIFGLPMDRVVETVRLPRDAVQTIKRQKTAVLRGKIVPLLSLNELLAIPNEQQTNEDDEYAILVVRVRSEQVGLIVDDFREVVDVILKPLPGELARLTCYAGSALLGDGTVLMVLDPRELV